MKHKIILAAFLIVNFQFSILNLNAQQTDFLPSTQWIGAITHADAHLPIGRRDLHDPSFRDAEMQDIFNAINPLALRSILLRKEFTVKKPITKATIFICGLGQYELSINGKKINNDIFTPAWSQYDKTVYYNVYQIDTLLNKDKNAVGIILGNGFYNAVGKRYRKLWVSFGAPTLLCELRIDYQDGTHETIASDSSWCWAESPITFNDIYGGEDYDARLEQDNWNMPNFDDKKWQKAVVQQAPKGKLRRQTLENVQIRETFPAVKMTKVDSSYILDMGQNLAGFPVITMQGAEGQTVKFTLGEQLNSASGKVSQNQSGSPYYFQYTLKGTSLERWQPRFSYYGYRYIQIDGANVLSYQAGKPYIVDIQSNFIYNSAKNIGSFECSNELLNKTHTLIQNALKSNMVSIFTDCPHREKLGWLEQIHLCCGAILYNWDMRNFFPKIMQDIADTQLDNGMIATTAPEYVRFGNETDVFRNSPEWSISALMIPHLYYQFYGDKSLIINYYKVMKRNVDYLTSLSVNSILNIGLGDWYDYDGGKGGFAKNSPVEVSATAHYFYATHLLAQAAQIVGNKSDAKKYTILAEKIRQAFNNKYFNSETKQYSTGSQFCNAVAIFMNLVEEKNKSAVLENLKRDIQQHKNRLTTGDVGNRYLFMTLAQNNENELLYKMINHEDVPGYGFQLKFGATTLTEQWDPRQGSSWNHFMLGQIDEWFFRSLAGIEPKENGFRKFKIEPKPVGDLTFVKATYRDISVEWTVEDDTFNLDIKIPENSQAEIILPNGEKTIKTTGNYSLKCKLL